MMKNALYFMLKTLFVLEIFAFLPWFFVYVEKQLAKKAMVRPPQKISHVSGNPPGKKFFITHPPAQSNEYQNIYFYAILLCTFNLLDRAVSFAWLFIWILCSLCATREIKVFNILQQHMKYTLSISKIKENHWEKFLFIIFSFIPDYS